MPPRRTITLLGLIAVVAGALTATTGVLPVGAQDSPAKRAAKGELRAPVITMNVQKNGQTVTVTRTLPFISAGTVDAAAQALAANGSQDIRQEEADSSAAAADMGNTSVASGPGTLGCDRDQGAKGNERVNQDCSFRRQAEEMITYNPADPNNLLAGQNDSRVGYNQCGIDWSTDNGAHWGDLLPPFRQRLNAPQFMGPSASNPNNNTIGGGPGTLHTYDAGSDPATAMDSQGRGFFSCVTFDVFSNATGLFVTESPLGAHGSFFYNVPGPPSKNFMVVEDNNGLVLHDKNMIAADRYASSPNRDNVYVTWTVFKFDQTTGAYQQSPIFGSMSTDHARTWSTPEDISGASDALCFLGNFFDPTLAGNKCDFDQGSNPTVLPNGDLAVVFNNGNTPPGVPNGQQLSVLCHPTGSSTAGTAHLNCGAPAKVGDDIIVGEPLCNFGRGPEECIPGAYIRTNDYPIVSKNTQNGHLFATWQDYRNGEFDIQLSESTDGGLSWTEVGTVNPDRGLDHYFPAVERALVSGDRVGDSYFRTARVPDENVTPAGGFGCPPGTTSTAPFQCSAGPANSDYVLAGGADGQTPYDFKVVSPPFSPPDGIQSGFNGDYSGLTINKGTDAHPIWSDTRNADPYAPTNGVVHDEDIFTDNIGLPNGHGNEGSGDIGRR